ncbi:MAG TPA: flagellar export chaperone FliS [Clostridiaceae bacterium]|nr:flagellar export chaperone FliS [Clostridiaceae bacterium]
MAVNKAYSQYYNQYKENTIFTSTPEELTLMLYNGLVKFIMQAQLAIEEKQFEKANSSIIRAQDIVFELQNTLDHKYEISKSLALLYDYMHRRLVDANLSKDKDILEEVLGYATELRDTWAQAMKIAKKERRA